MSPKDAIRSSIGLSERVIRAYINDLSDSDLLIRAVPGMNCVAWQLGHLISTERRLMEMVAPGVSPELPVGFAEAHNKEASGSDEHSGFRTLAEYQAVWKSQRSATLDALESFPESELDRTDPDRFPPFAPTAGAIFMMCGNHPLMHAGQFVPVRRLTGKPITI